MTDRSEGELLAAISAGDEKAFEQIYDLYQRRARLVAWRLCRRADWLDDLLNEAWCRAFNQRKTYDPARPFLVWMAGILRNVYREFCRKSPLSLSQGEISPEASPAEIDDLSPETIAHEAEVLAGLNACLDELEPGDARIVRLRFFGGMPLRAVAQEVRIPESTLRETRLPTLLARLRRCMERKKIDFSDVFSAQGPD